ncbi:glycosyltransferase [Flexistipes sp.]|uniref:glycosyltransferase n=1 Tax=Flexistipes sp. TaxID=3088135 RepID=UPI002E245664|nr:glycosyltransferase [Flexistipes sp.]
MKVLYVIGALPYGGVENLLFETVNNMKHYGVTPYIVNLAGIGEQHQAFVNSGIETISVGKGNGYIKTHRLDTAWKLRKIIKSIAPDVIHTMHFSADFFGRLSALFMNIPVIVHIHNPRIAGKIHRKILNRALSYKTSAYISVSQEVKKQVELYHNLAVKPNKVIYNGINRDKFANLQKDKNSKQIFACGRLVKLKNFDILIKAFGKIYDYHPDYQLVIAGDGPEKNSLKKLIKDTGLENNVFLTGYRTDIPYLLSKSNIFVMPSESEGFGIAHLEAMFMGVPAIISENVGTKEIAANCSLICDKTEEDIAEKIDLLIKDKKLYEKLSFEAKRLSEDFTIDNYCSQLVNLYNQVLKNGL